MMQIIAPVDNSVADWVASKMPDDIAFAANDISIGIARDGRIAAGAVYHDHVPAYRGCQVSFASTGPGWASRRTVAALLYPPFRQLDCVRITALIRKKNKASRKLVEGLGFKLEGTVRKGFGDDSTCIYGLMHYEAEKWLEKFDG